MSTAKLILELICHLQMQAATATILNAAILNAVAMPPCNR
jgi:hypothetical protein